MSPSLEGREGPVEVVLGDLVVPVNSGTRRSYRPSPA